MTESEQLAVLRVALSNLKKTAVGYKQWVNAGKEGPYWEKAMGALDKLEQDLKPVPSLGPVLTGGRAILLEDPTHATDGIPGYIAFDTGFNDAGRSVLAPEELTITDDTSGAQGGDAFYAVGKSGLKYWFGHIRAVPKQGTKFRKGAKLSTIAPAEPGHKVPHLHLAIDSRPVIHRVLLYGRTGAGPDYTHGSPPIGIQLRG